MEILIWNHIVWATNALLKCKYVILGRGYMWTEEEMNKIIESES
jgi:hypothetical protein